jgi:4-amino-4-deoxy-L-arabinose transferase-like glycosyltransferase
MTFRQCPRAFTWLTATGSACATTVGAAALFMWTLYRDSPALCIVRVIAAFASVLLAAAPWIALWAMAQRQSLRARDASPKQPGMRD